MAALAGCDARRRSRRMAIPCKRSATQQRARQHSQNVQVIVSRLLNPLSLAAPLLALFLLAACGEPPPPAAAAPPPPTFSLAPLADVAIHPERSAPAAVIGRDEARISAEVAATILALPAEVGQRVRQGAVIARLDPRDAELALERAAAALAQAEARQAQAQAQFERARTLREKNFYSAEALTLRETELAATAADRRAARAQRDTARRHLDKHTLTAPFDAIVRARPGQTGELATPGMPLLVLVSAEAVELSARLQPRDAETLAAAPGPVFATAGRHHQLRLLRISPALDRDTRSREARLAFVAEPPPVGSEGRLLWRETQAHVPAALLVRRDGRLGIFVATEGVARFHALDSAQEGRLAAIDLPGETRVVVQGHHALRDGMTLP